MGIINPENKCLLIEDVTFTGQTVLDFIKILKDKNLNTPYVRSILDVEKGAKETFKNKNIKYYNLFTWKDLYQEYCKSNKVENFVLKYIN